MSTLTQAEQVRADRFRRKLNRMGYTLMKSAARDPDDITYDGFQIIKPDGAIIAGHGNLGRGFGLSLDDVERWIEAASNRRQ